MTFIARLVLVSALAVPGLMPMAAFAQSVRVLGDHSAWSAYSTTEDAGQICFMLSNPSETTPTPEGFTEGYFYVTHRPDAGVRAEINVVAGYQFAADSEAVLTVDGRTFALFTQGDAAWLADPGQAQAVFGAIRAGLTMSVSGTSQRGIEVTQTFSLSGSSASADEIDSAC